MLWNDYHNGVYAFDADYVRPYLAAIHLIEDSGEVALVDTGTNDSLPAVHAALERLRLSAASVKYIVLTHIHLDHAGGAGVMMQAFPRAKLVVHPRGTRHMIAPEKLLVGVRAVYGAEATAKLYGDLLPVPAERIIEATDGLRLTLGQRSLTCVDTPGHARHHICLFDEKSRSLFTGDLFGLSYREFDVDGRKFIFPTTTPSQFEPKEMHTSIDRVLSLQPDACYLTHYTRVTPVDTLAQQLHEQIDDFCAIARAAPADSALRHPTICQDLRNYLFKALRTHGCTLPETEIEAILATDIDLNAQGLEIWLDGEGHA